MVTDPLAQAAGSPQRPRLHSDIWTVQDHLRYSVYADALAKFIQDPETRAPFVIAVQGPWGQGKTSFMRMVQKKLDSHHPDFVESDSSEPQAYTSSLNLREVREELNGNPREPRVFPKNEIRTVWFNAWNHQNSEQLWAGLAHCIISQLAMRLEGTRERELFWLRLQLHRIDPDNIRREVYRSTFEHLPLIVASLIIPILFLFGYLSKLLIGSYIFTALVALTFRSPLTVMLLKVIPPLALAVATFGVPWLWATQKALSEKLKGTYVQLVRQPEYRERMGFFSLVQEDVTQALKLLVKRDRPAVVFIDDLDRCPPSNVAEVIGAINLFLADSHRHCIFVLGMDTEVVAASMEVAHEKIIDKLPERNGELGWSYMDKFIQLPIVLPRLFSDGQKSYLESLLNGPEPSTGATYPHAATPTPLPQSKWAGHSVRDLYRSLVSHIGVGRQFSASSHTFAATPSQGEKLGTVPAFGMSSKEILLKQLDHLSNNPRTLKRVVNLFRFHVLLQEERRRATGEDPADSEQILAWVILLARWPFFVRWLQRLGRQTSEQPQGQTPGGPTGDEIADKMLQKVIERAQMTENPPAWDKELEEEGINHRGWAFAPGLFEFLKKGHELRLEKASPHGFW
jgi:Cdc6-like AAA superfamily ATPase